MTSIATAIATSGNKSWIKGAAKGLKGTFKRNFLVTLGFGALAGAQELIETGDTSKALNAGLDTANPISDAMKLNKQGDRNGALEEGVKTAAEYATWTTSAAAGAALGTLIPVPFVGTALGFIAGGTLGYFGSQSARSATQSAIDSDTGGAWSAVKGWFGKSDAENAASIAEYKAQEKTKEPVATTVTPQVQASIQVEEKKKKTEKEQKAALEKAATGMFPNPLKIIIAIMDFFIEHTVGRSKKNTAETSVKNSKPDPVSLHIADNGSTGTPSLRAGFDSLAKRENNKGQLSAIFASSVAGETPAAGRVIAPSDPAV